MAHFVLIHLQTWPPQAILVSDWSISKNLLLWNCFAKRTEIWWEAPMEGSVLSFLKAKWKVSDTCSAHWVSSFILYLYLNLESCTSYPLVITVITCMFCQIWNCWINWEIFPLFTCCYYAVQSQYIFAHNAFLRHRTSFNIWKIESRLFKFT